MIKLVVVLSALCALASAGRIDLPGSRVVGGTDADHAQFPHQVSLQKQYSHTCGGSIISKRVILTAAHCVAIGGGVHPYPASHYQVRVGSINRSAGGTLYNVAKILIHENYGNFLNDVALLFLEEDIEYGPKAQPIPLQQEELAPGTKVTISGWGRLETGGNIPYRLQENTLTSLDKAECNDRIGWGYDSLLCLDHEKGNGACNGDSGGPAIFNKKVVGIAGFVVNGCGSDNPDGYAKVAYHYDWIVKNANL